MQVLFQQNTQNKPPTYFYELNNLYYHPSIENILNAQDVISNHINYSFTLIFYRKDKHIKWIYVNKTKLSKKKNE